MRLVEEADPGLLLKEQPLSWPVLGESARGASLPSAPGDGGHQRPVLQRGASLRQRRLETHAAMSQHAGASSAPPCRAPLADPLHPQDPPLANPLPVPTCCEGVKTLRAQLWSTCPRRLHRTCRAAPPAPLGSVVGPWPPRTVSAPAGTSLEGYWALSQWRVFRGGVTPASPPDQDSGPACGQGRRKRAPGGRGGLLGPQH